MARPAETSRPVREGPSGRVGRSRAAPDRSAAAASAATTSPTAAAGRTGRGRAATARDSDCGQQLDGVGVALRAVRRVARSTHRTADFERGATRPAPELITRHPTSVGPVR